MSGDAKDLQGRLGANSRTIAPHLGFLFPRKRDQLPCRIAREEERFAAAGSGQNSLPGMNVATERIPSLLY